MSQELKKQLDHKLDLIAELKNTKGLLKGKGDQISTANNRYGAARAIVVRYEKTVFFKLYILYLWVINRKEYKNIKRILDESIN